MTDYVISYDICALVIMGMFSVYYFTRKRLKSAKNVLFNVLCISITLSIFFDIASVMTLRYRTSLPVALNYFTNESYFLITGFVAVAFCMYSISETRSYLGHRKSIFFLFYFFPYVLFALAILSTPFSHLVLYFDENRDYNQGPLMGILLIVVIAYIVYSMIRVTFMHDNVTLVKRFSYYAFATFMSCAILCQWFFPRLLLYGIAEAMGIIVMYLSNHNVAEFLDAQTNLFNRNALITNLKEAKMRDDRQTIIGLGVKRFVWDKAEVEEGSFSEIIITQVASFLEKTAGPNGTYYIGNSGFVLRTGDDAEAEEMLAALERRFAEPWKIRNHSIICKVGISKIVLNEDTNDVYEAFDLVISGINYSFKNGGFVSTADSLRDEKEKLISTLEKQHRRLEAKYLETENKMEKAIQADKSKSLFLAQMSHEIRTPMTAILGMTELISRETKEEEVLEHAHAIMSSGRSLIGIINDILDFSKIEAGKLQIIDEKYSLRDCVFDIINGIEQRVSEKRLDLEVYYDPAIPRTLYGDSIRVKQIVTNLMTNAVKYTEKGSVHLFMNIQDIEPEYVTLKISVRDTGIGIREENISKLFDGFERFDSQRNKAIEGTGLGLAICRQLLDAMGGNIEVESTYGVGSTFTVTLKQKIVDASPSVVIDNAADLNILVYCGKDTEMSAYRHIFEDFNIKADYARTSDEFLTMFDRKNSSYTHLFITYGEFERRLAQADPIVDDPRLVISVYYRQYMANLKKHKAIHMPVCSINFADLICGRSALDNTSTGDKRTAYTAPEVNLLVVDDNIVNLRIFTGLLECHKMQIDTADNGDKCIELARHKRYDIIFLDHMMPRKDGIETLHELRGDEQTMNEDTPVVAFTANAVSGMREMFLENGFSAFLSKPIDIEKLEELLLNYIPAELIEETEVDAHGAAGSIAAVGSGNADSQGNAGNATDNMSYNSDYSKTGDNNMDSSTYTNNANGEFSVKGLDMEKALHYTGGTYGTLRSVLEVFVQDGTKKRELLAQLIEQQDFENYRIEIHAVKSLCKGIGADELSERARLLEMAAKEGDTEYVVGNCEGVRNDYCTLLDNIEETLKDIAAREAAAEVSKAAGDGAASGTSTAAGEGSGSVSSLMDVNEQLTCILALIHEFEEDLAAKLAEDLVSRHIPDPAGTKINAMYKALKLFDFDGAAAIISEVINEN